MNEYDRAVALWIGRHENIDPDSITLIEFQGMSGCDTCGYGEGAAISFYSANHRMNHIVLDEPGTFVAECVELLEAARLGGVGWKPEPKPAPVPKPAVGVTYSVVPPARPSQSEGALTKAPRGSL